MDPTHTKAIANADGEVPLHAAVRADDSSFVSDLLRAHEDVDIGVNLQNHRGMSVVGGKLSFKGDKKKKKKRERENPSDDDEPLDVPEHSLDPVAGTGKLTSSGVVVTGVDTDFTAELSVGDTLLVTVVDRFRNTQSDESRVVNMVLGRTSLNVQGPFTCDLTSPTAFMFVRKAPDVEALRAARDARKRQERRLAEESSSVTYKVVVPGSGTWKKWKTVTETGGERTREEMLDMRAKNKTDRHAR